LHELGYWKLVIASISGFLPALMVDANYFSYEYKPPFRIENWKPEPAR
jgi:hypothetical protein